MRALPIALLLLLSPAPSASACLNYYGKNIKGDMIESDDSVSNPTKFLRELISHPGHDEILKKDLGPEPAADLDFRIRNDYAANLIRQGKTKRAIEILESIEKSRPGEYQIAANLGTAYELIGDVDRAHTWISEGLQRYPNLHLQTEWLHLRILEVKRELAKDPNWLKTHSVLDFSFGTDAIPVPPASWGKMGEQRVLEALRYQLHERLAFVSPPEPIVGELIGVYADHIALTSPAEYAVPLYDLALSFKPSQADVLEKRRAQAQSQVRSALSSGLSKRDLPPELLGLAAVVLLVIALIAIRTRNRRRSRTENPGPGAL